MTLSRHVPLRNVPHPGTAWNSTLRPSGSWSRAVPLDGAGRKSAATKTGTSRPKPPCTMCREPAQWGSRYCAPCLVVRELVLERDSWSCVCCGTCIIDRHYSLGHRLRASQGGRAVPSNLLVFLGWGGEACHGRIDSRRDPEDEAKGFTVRSWQDPAQVPVMVFSEHDSGGCPWLWDDGEYHFDGPQPEAGAA